VLSQICRLGYHGRQPVKGTLERGVDVSTHIGMSTLLLLLVVSVAFVPVWAKTNDLQPYTQSEKGLMIDSLNIIKALPVPSLQTLREAGFTLVGTTLDHRFTSSQLKTIAGWIDAVKASGLRSFLRLSTKMDPDIASTWVKKAALMGPDVVLLDELLGRYYATKEQLQTIISNGVKQKGGLQFIVTEYSIQDLANAYAWTAQYPNVRVASDDYIHKGTIDSEVTLAEEYNKRPLVWLIFSQGSMDFDCYLNLDEWIAYVKQQNVDTTFWWVDPSGTWTTHWSAILSF
jgi:hypothetical protein